MGGECFLRTPLLPESQLPFLSLYECFEVRSSALLTLWLGLWVSVVFLRFSWLVLTRVFAVVDFEGLLARSL